LERWRNIEILEMNVKEDHIHMILSIYAGGLFTPLLENIWSLSLNIPLAIVFYRVVK